MDKLRVEYIVAVRKNSAFCNSIKTFNNLLTANADIEVKAKKLRHKSLEVAYEIQKSELDAKDLRFFHIKFICSETGRINEFEDLLKTVRTITFKTDGHLKILWDDIAFFYAIRAYPLINEIENMMRRLIIQFMLTSVGVDWDKEALPKDIKENIGNKKRASANGIASILHETDFIQLADCLFKPYITKNIETLYKIISEAKDLSNLNLSELKEYSPKSNWSRYFSSLVDCEDGFLSKRWGELYDLRCLVAHNNLLQKSDYEQILALTSEVRPILQKAIDNIHRISIPEEEKDNLAENVVVNINDQYGEFISWWRELEIELRRIAASLISDKQIDRMAPSQLVEISRSSKLIDKETSEKIISLYRARNAIVHGRDNDEAIGDLNQKIGLLKDIVINIKTL